MNFDWSVKELIKLLLHVLVNSVQLPYHDAFLRLSFEAQVLIQVHRVVPISDKFAAHEKYKSAGGGKRRQLQYLIVVCMDSSALSVSPILLIITPPSRGIRILHIVGR